MKRAIEEARDVSERKKAELELQRLSARLAESTQRAQQLAQRAEMASRAKSDFLARMSHEIRTPMNGVLGMTELLQATELNTRQRELANTARLSAESLLGNAVKFTERGEVVLRVAEFEATPQLVSLRIEVQDTGIGLAPEAQERVFDSFAQAVLWKALQRWAPPQTADSGDTKAFEAG